MDSGRFSGQRSNFSHTCALLSQYLKEKGSFGDLSLGPPTMNLSGQNSDLKPLNLFPGKKTDLSVGKTDLERAPMTIFFNGQVMIFNDFPAEKAKEIIGLAINTQNPNNILPCTDPTSVVPIPVVSKVVTGFGNQRSYSDLPIARRSSLARFLEKRKDRITSKAPYQKSSHVEAYSQEEDSKTWLGLSNQFPVKIEHHL